MTGTYKEYSRSVYDKAFDHELEDLATRKKRVEEKEAERMAQKEAIKAAVLETMRAFPQIEPALIWRGIYEVHVRVTRDREPSLAAMHSFFWSTVIVLDGDFMKNPKFLAMVDGGTHEYPDNGWHGMYVFSDLYKGQRIYPIHVDFGKFAEHAKIAAEYWRTQRQWFDEKWKAE